jgi:hypothetical protein
MILSTMFRVNTNSVVVFFMITITIVNLNPHKPPPLKGEFNVG